MTRFDGVRFDVIAVDDVKDDDVAVAAVQCDGETACLVAVKLPFDVSYHHEDVMSAIVERRLRNGFHWISFGIGLGGSCARTFLVHVAYLCLIDDFDELSNAFGGEAWPPSEVASIDGFAPG